jgi:hypothetical protein
VLIVAGDVALSIEKVAHALGILRSKFRRVFFTFGRFETQIMGRELDSHPDSIAKIHSMFKACDDLLVETCPALVCEGVYIWPLHSWCNPTFDESDPKPDTNINIDVLCRWPLDEHAQVWKYLLDMNETFLDGPRAMPSRGNDDTVITFSHFLPRTELPYHDADDFKYRQAKVVGCKEIDTQLRAAGSKVHVYGRSHWRWNLTMDGVMYANQPVGYPMERIFIHQDDEAQPGNQLDPEKRSAGDVVMLLQVFDGTSTCKIPWDVQRDQAGSYRMSQEDS